MTQHGGGPQGGMPREACVAPPMAMSRPIHAARFATPVRRMCGVLVPTILAFAALVLAIETRPSVATERMTAPLLPAPRRVLVPEYRIDIDRADHAELSLLPEIGPALAARIAADRAVHGAFGSIDALARVEGIGPARIAALRTAATASGVEGMRDAGVEARR